MREHVAMISHKETVGHVGQFLRVMFRQVYRRGELVCDDVVHVTGTTGAWIP